VSGATGFARSLALALLAALGCPPWLGVAGPALGWGLAFQLYAVGSAALYLAAIAPRRMTGVLAAGALGAGGCALALGGASLHTTCVAMALGLGALRSIALWPGTTPGGFTARALAEFALLGGGLALASHLFASRTPFPGALALWGFFLAQSAFFLIPGLAARASAGAAAAGDPFELTTRRLRALLDERN
jgi:hypothetical protein